MQLESAEDLIQALQGSGLFTAEQFQALIRELAPLNKDLQTVMRYLVKRERITIYQLQKILHNKANDLFVGPYVVLDKLGEGGMGKVFRARQSRMDRTVALKVVRSALVANPVIRGRYEREVQAATRLDHPNIVRLYDAGEANGRFYLAMEFVDGIDLARLMRDYRLLEIPEACEYIRQAALGLQHAHEQGFIHRDVKPSNIVVAGERHVPQATEPAVVKLLDLGLARAIDPDDMVEPDLTRDHTVVGTPDYMAPEQAKNSKLVDPRADQYSLGCTLYFLLTGCVPFPGGNAIEKLMQHQLEQPAPLQALRPGVSEELAGIVARLMSKRPDDRFATAGELAASLEPHSRYPDGAAPVPIIAVGTDDQPGGRLGDTLPQRSTFPPGAFGSSSGPSPLPSVRASSVRPSPLPDTSQEAQPVAPSDNTPRPPALHDALPMIEPSTPHASAKRYPASKKGQPRTPRGRPPNRRILPWVVGGIAAAILLAVAVWAVTLDPAKRTQPTKPSPNPGTKLPLP